MKKLIVVLLMLVVACGKEENRGAGIDSNGNIQGPSSIYGTWQGLPELELNGVKLKTVMQIEPGYITNRVTCIFQNGKNLSTQAKARIEITSDTLKVLEKAENTTKEDGKHCSASVDVSETKYRVENHVLTLGEGEKKVLLSRSK